eukprot:11626550-Prorocentrum_lima.AAC.1
MCIRDSLGGMQGPDPLPKLTPPADVVVQHLGGVPIGWHVRDVYLVHNGKPGFVFHPAPELVQSLRAPPADR